MQSIAMLLKSIAMLLKSIAMEMQSIAMKIQNIAMKQEYCNGFVNMAVSAYHMYLGLAISGIVQSMLTCEVSRYTAVL